MSKMNDKRKMGSWRSIVSFSCTWCLESKQDALVEICNTYAEYFYVTQWSRVDTTYFIQNTKGDADSQDCHTVFYHQQNYSRMEDPLLAFLHQCPWQLRQQSSKLAGTTTTRNVCNTSSGCMKQNLETALPPFTFYPCVDLMRLDL